jgi:hypothetical protein
MTTFGGTFTAPLGTPFYINTNVQFMHGVGRVAIRYEPVERQTIEEICAEANAYLNGWDYNDELVRLDYLTNKASEWAAFNAARDLEWALAGARIRERKQKIDRKKQLKKAHYFLHKAVECILCEDDSTIDYISLEPLKKGERIAKIRACGHTFAQDGIKEWIGINPSCPVCRCTLT